LLHAERTYCFNAQYEINSLLTDSDKKTNPLIFRNAGNPELRKYFDTKGFITHPERIYYFYSNKSNWDIEQHAHIKDLGINVISFNTNTHGPPVLKCSMSAVLSLSEQQLKGFVGKENKPFWFSCKLVGFPVTVAGVYDQVIAKVKNKTRNLMSTGKLH